MEIGRLEKPQLGSLFKKKFILISEPNNDTGKDVFSIICRNVNFHFDIVHQLRLSKIDFKIYGGGFLIYDEESKELTLLGKSTDYGVADPEKSSKVADEWCKFNDFKLNNELKKEIPLY